MKKILMMSAKYTATAGEDVVKQETLLDAFEIRFCRLQAAGHILHR